MRSRPADPIESFLDEGGPRSSRYVDLQIDWVRYKSGTHIARHGGRWDRKRKRYTGDAATSRVIEVHAAQITAVETFDQWLGDQLAGRDASALNDRIREIIEGELEIDAETGAAIGISELFLSGGRRSGKSVIAEGLATSYAISVPGAIVWTVTPNESFHEEPRQILSALMPAHWYEYLGDPHFTFEIVNGSQHILRSGHKPTGLKKGKADIVVVNEAQQVPAASYRNARGATIDDGGLTIAAMNPPTLGDVGEWTSDAVAKTEIGQRPGARHLFVDPLDNPHIDVSKLLALKSSMTLHDWETQIRGRFMAHPGAVLYSWSRSDNERAEPDLGDITHEFLTAHEGDRANWNAVASVDVQLYPFISIAVARVFRDPRDPMNPREGLLWVRREVALAQADEVDAATELKKFVDPKRTLLIMDATCRWQQAQRDLIRQRPNFTGKGSMDIFRALGFKHVVPPDRSMKGNPDVLERIRATQQRVKITHGIRGLYADPNHCPTVIDSAVNWRMKHGKPSRRSDSAHFGDCLGYLVWRFFPRRGAALKVIDDAVPRDLSSLDAQ